MAIHNKPDESVFASSARQGEVSNFPDIGRGWGISFDQTGGIPPMEWFNFLFKRTDERFGYLFQRGLSEWSATQEYPIGALVQYKNLTYKAKRANTNKNPEQADSLDWQRWGFTKAELGVATLTSSGVTKLLTSVTSNDESMAATPKAVKVAYDKGAEAKTAADNAQRSADNANTNANGRVSKNGDTMSGPLIVPRVSTGNVESSGYLNVSSNNGVVFYNKGNSAYTAILSENGLDIKKAVMSHEGLKSDHLGYGGYGSQYNYSAPFEVIEAAANSVGTFYPFIKGKVMSRGNSGAAFSLGYTTKQTGYNEYGNFGRGVINLVEDNGSFKNWEFEHTGVFRSAGDVITGNGNSLDWHTHVLNSLIGGITSSSYGSHYQGADVFKIKQNRLMIIRMQIGVVNSSGDYYLPESFDGSAGAIAIDSGGAVNPVGAFFKGGNSVYISVTKPTNVTVIAIGVKN
jgi:probable tail fiber protein (fragment)|nr:MAG TPA: Baseplate structural protein [Caudoviricetes sp.]